MSILKNLGKNIGKTAKSVTKKSEELVEITKLNLAIGNEEDKIKKLMLEIGTELYGRYAQGEIYDEFLNAKCEQVKVIKDNIDALKERVSYLKSHNDNNVSEEPEIVENTSDKPEGE